MKSIAPTTPYGYTVFCDDVRQEVGGKVSYIGIYRSDLIVYGALPAQLAKFCFVVYYYERFGESIEPVTLKIFVPSDEGDTTIVDVELPVDEARAHPPKLESPDSDVLISISSVFSVTPFILKAEGRVRVRAYRGDTEIRLGTLFVVANPAATEERDPDK